MAGLSSQYETTRSVDRDGSFVDGDCNYRSRRKPIFRGFGRKGSARVCQSSWEARVIPGACFVFWAHSNESAGPDGNMGGRTPEAEWAYSEWDSEALGGRSLWSDLQDCLDAAEQDASERRSRSWGVCCYVFWAPRILVVLPGSGLKGMAGRHVERQPLNEGLAASGDLPDSCSDSRTFDGGRNSLPKTRNSKRQKSRGGYRTLAPFPSRCWSRSDVLEGHPGRLDRGPRDRNQGWWRQHRQISRRASCAQMTARDAHPRCRGTWWNRIGRVPDSVREHEQYLVDLKAKAGVVFWKWTLMRRLGKSWLNAAWGGVHEGFGSVCDGGLSFDVRLRQRK